MQGRAGQGRAGQGRGRGRIAHAGPGAHARLFGHEMEYVLGIEVLVRLHSHGGAPQRSRASIGPYRVAGARTPRALYRTMAADSLIPRHDHSGACSTGRDVPAQMQRRRRVGGWVLA